MNWKYIFNPYLKFSEKQLLTVGILGFLGITYFGFVFKSPLISIFKFAEDPELTLLNSFIYTGLSFLSAIILLFILGKIFNRQTRIIDIINTIGISQIPLLAVLAVSNIQSVKNVQERISNSLNVQSKYTVETWEIALLLFFLLASLPILIYSIVLFFNGFKIATNTKSWQKISVFVTLTLIFLIIYQFLILKLSL